jgi:1-pyrroline-5-carboxylate dehydrogenase
LGVISEPYAVQNLVDGKWFSAATTMEIIHPMDKDAPPIFTIPDTTTDEIAPFVESLKKVPKSGVHNPFKNPERYVALGEISRKAGELLAKPVVAEFFTQLIMACVPKSHGT